VTSRRPVTASRTRVPRAQREQQILTVAEQVFAERGYSATTMEDIADHVGVTKPLIYDYFGSKEGLLSAAVSRARTQLGDATDAAWHGAGADAPLEAVFRAGVRAFFDFIDEHANAFALIQQEGALASRAGSLLESIREQQSAATVRTLRGAAGLGSIPDEVLEGYAEVVIGACERVAVWRTRGHHVTAAEATELVVAAVWTGLASLVGPGAESGEAPGQQRPPG
jgi:AcrR family transcriptional regulator